MSARRSALGILAAGTSWNVIGLAGGQVVVLAATPLLARIYSPTEFGLYAAFAGIASVLYAISALRFEILVPNVRAEEAADAALLVLVASSAMALLVAGLLALGGARALAPVLGSISVPWLLPLVVLFAGAGQARVYLAVRSGDFRVNALYRLANPSIFALLALALPALGLVWAHVLGLSVGLVFVWACRHSIGGSVRRARDVARANFAVPLRLLPAALMDACAVALPIVFIGSIYGAATAGELSQVHRLVAGPLLLLAAAAALPIHSETSRLTRLGAPVWPVLRFATLSLVAIGGTWALAVMLAGSEMLRLLLGPQWRTDQGFVLLVLAAVLVRFVVSPASAMLLALGRHRALFAWQSALFVWVVGALPFAARALTFDDFLLVFAAVETLFYLVYAGLIAHAAHAHDRFLGQSRHAAGR